MKKYLLPCECGQKIEVDAGQSGLTVTCACGKKLEVPTLRGLSGLEVVPSRGATQPAAAEAAWGPGQGLLFLGTVLLICGVIALALVLRTRPEWKVHSGNIAVDVDRLTPGQLFERWQELRKGLVANEDPIRQSYDADWATFRRRRTMACLPLAIGVLLIVAGFLMRKPRAQPDRPRLGARR